jgi:hypothetical protein
LAARLAHDRPELEREGLEIGINAPSARFLESAQQPVAPHFVVRMYFHLIADDPSMRPIVGPLRGSVKAPVTVHPFRAPKRLGGAIMVTRSG